MPRRLKHLTFGVIAILALLASLEGGVRLLGIKARVDNPFFMLVRVFEYPDFFEKDEDLFWRLRPNIAADEEFLVPGSYRTNSLGFRGAELEEQALSTYTIACFGNSCTFGWRLAEEQTFPGQLQQRLAPLSRAQFRVSNCGIPGYSSFQGQRLIKETITLLKPRVITICYGWNDHWAAAFDLEDKEQKTAPQIILEIQNFLAKSHLYRAVKYALLSRSEKSREYTYDRQSPKYRVSLPDYEANLRSIIEECRAQSIVPILLTTPIGDTDPGVINAVEEYHERYNAVVRDIAAESGVLLVDAARLLDGKPECFDDPKADFIHYNARGAALIADTVAAVIATIP